MAPMYSDDNLMTLLQEFRNGVTDYPPFHRGNILYDIERLINRATWPIGEYTKWTQNPFRLDRLNETHRGLRDNAGEPIIGSISCKVTSAILNGTDAHTVTIGLLKYLRNCGWHEKLLLTLIAIVATFGDFWILVRINAKNSVNEPRTVDQREATTANKDAYKSQIQANNDFIKCVFDSAQCVIDLKQMPASYSRDIFRVVGEGPYMYTSGESGLFPVYVYWIMRCAIVAATQILILSSRGLDQYLVGIPEPMEYAKLNSLKEYMMLKLSEFRERERKWCKISKFLSHYLDNAEMMKSFITPNTDLHPLYHSVTKRKDHLDVLTGKRVLLLISGLNIASEDITNLKNVTIDSEKDEIVWIPVLKHTASDSNAVENQLETLQNSMPWYSIHQPSLITDQAIEAFIVEWHFEGTPILVFRSAGGDVININAIYMLRIWRNLHINNLTSEMELQLWMKETWNLKFLVNDIDPIIQEWIRDEKYILMYGSNDIDWIRNFISQTHSIAHKMFLHIEMIYVGNSRDKDYGRNVEDVIMKEQLSHCLPESSRTSFWSRINAMIESMEKLGRVDGPSYKLFQEILRFKNHEEWVLLAKGSSIIGHVSSRIASTVVEEVQKWKTTLFK